MNGDWAQDLAAALAAWRRHAGDMTVIAWTITIGYVAAAWWCGAWARRQTGDDARRRRMFWGLLAAGLFALGLNKQLDLQTLLVQVGRVVAQRGGWHEQRRLVQAVFVVLLAGGMGGAALAGGLYFRSLFRPLWLAWLGVALLALYVIMRAALFMNLGNHIPLPGHHAVAYPLLEAGGIALVASATALRRRHGPRQDG